MNLDPQHHEMLVEIKENDGVPIVESLRRAVEKYYAQWRKEKDDVEEH